MYVCQCFLLQVTVESFKTVSLRIILLRLILNKTLIILSNILVLLILKNIISTKTF